MTSFGSPNGNVLYLVVSAATGAEDTLDRIRAEQAAGWEVCAVLTPQALHWTDAAAIEELTGHPLQIRMRNYGEPLFEPLGDAVLVAPASFNTISKVAAGMADNMATGLICEAIGRQVPVTMEPSVGDSFAAHPAFPGNIELLRGAGVRFVWRRPDHDPTGSHPLPEPSPG